MPKKSLYLAGGGARGAYQAGALKAISHILQVKNIPFEIVSGVSVGSINAAILAENADDFPTAVEKLETLWSDIYCQQIYKTSNLALSKSVMRNMSTMLIKQRQAAHLLDTTPLQSMLEDQIDFSKISQNINNGVLRSLEILSNCYETRQTISFYEHHNSEFLDWNYPRHSSKRVSIQAKHILASSALPLFFPTVLLDGFHYGDGSVGLDAPLRGAIRFEVDKILIIGTRALPEFMAHEHLRNEDDLPFSHIFGNMFNALFLDNLDRDIEMVNRMNEIAMLLSIWKKRRSPWRPIKTTHLRPSQDLAPLAQNHFGALPTLLRYLMSILGEKKQSGDLLSFVLFEHGYTKELIQLGFQDTLHQAQIIETFFKS